MTSEKRRRIHPTIRMRSRKLRKNLTPAERKLWGILRNRNLGNYKFRRQHPIGPFITDFCCPEVQLVVEVDGGIHASRKEYDQNRTAWLNSQGYHVIRFHNQDVLTNSDQVAQEILRVCNQLKKENP